MKTRTIILFAVLAAIGSVASAEEFTRPPANPMPKPTPGVPSEPDPVTLKPSTTINASARATSAADASNSLSIGGDNTKSVVAVFPPPSTAVVPVAQNCIVTKSNAGGIGWNLIQGAGSEQYSDPVCILQWLEVTATSDDERASIRAEIMKRIGAN